MSGNLTNRKVYVGAIPYKVTEDELKELAAKYGTIETLFYMQDQSEQNKGWAFVTYKTKEEADTAVIGIQTICLHNSDKPLTAEIAPSKTNSSTNGATTSPPPVNQTVVTTPLVSSFPQNTPIMANNANHMIVSSTPATTPATVYAPQTMLQQQQLHAATAMPAAAVVPAAVAPAATPYSVAATSSIWQQFYTQDGHTYYYNTQTCQSQWERPPELDMSSSAPLQQIQASAGQATANLTPGMVAGTAIGVLPGAGVAGYMQPAPAAYNPQAAMAAAAALAATTSSSFGPPGSNLFIFHVPNDWNDYDLVQHFQPFGNILSARIHRDRNGNNRGYGFISYDNVQSSINAIKGMNGFAVSGKHLKVQVKKGEEKHIPQSILQSCTLPHSVAGAAALTNGIFIGPNAAIRYSPY